MTEMQMVKLFFWVLVLVTLDTCVVPLHGAQEQHKLLGSYRLVWEDTFDGQELDQTKWRYRLDNKMLSSQNSSNVFVSDGMLHIRLAKNSGSRYQYSGGGVISKREFGYGYYEAKLMISAGSGWHSSFWMMHTNGQDTLSDTATLELDALENKSADLGYYETNVHEWAVHHVDFGAFGVRTVDLSKEFHVIGCEYTPTTIKYFMDGTLVHSYDISGRQQGEVNIWFSSIAEGNGSSKVVDDRALPGEMLVDWVRFYQISLPDKKQ